MSNIESDASFYIETVCSVNTRCAHALQKLWPFGVKSICGVKDPWEVVDAFKGRGCSSVEIPRSMGRGVVFQKGTMTLEGFVPRNQEK